MARDLAFNYPQLVQLRQDLRTHIPSDPTFQAAVGTVLRAWIDTIIDDAKERHEADQKKAAAEADKQAEAPAQEETKPATGRHR